MSLTFEPFVPGRKSEEDDFTGLLEEETLKLSAMPAEKNIEISEIIAWRQKAMKPSTICRGSAPEALQQTASSMLQDRAWNFAKRRLPPLAWWRVVSWETMRADVIAGITVGVMLIPQSMSYASLAGVPYVNGLYTGMVGALGYFWFGTSRHLAVGPVAMESLIIGAGLNGVMTPQECPAFFKAGNTKAQSALCPGIYTSMVIQTTACVGILEGLASALQLGFLIRFLGQPVVSGFTAGSAVVIGMSQLKDILGIAVPNVETVHEVIRNVHGARSTINGYAILFFFIWFVYLYIHKYSIGFLKRRAKRPALKMLFTVLEPLGALFSIIIGAAVIQGSEPLRVAPYKLSYVGSIPKGTPPWSGGMWQSMDLSRVLPTAITSFLVGDLEAISIAKKLATQGGYSIEPAQELLAQGLTNIIGGCFSCYTSTGSFSRSAVLLSLGAKTQMAGLLVGIVILITLLFLTPLFFFVPKFALAAIIVSAVLPLIDLQEAWRIFKISKLEFLVYLTCALGVMFWGVIQGIGLAVGLSLCILIFETARPQLTMLWRLPGTTIYRSIKQESNGSFIPGIFICRLGSSLYFANVAYIREILLTHLRDLEPVDTIKYVVLEMTPVISIDYTAANVLKDIVAEFRTLGIQIAFCSVGNRVEKMMRRDGIYEVIGEEWFCPHVHEAVEHCLRHRRGIDDEALAARDVEAALPTVVYGSETSLPPSQSSRKVVQLGDELSCSNDHHSSFSTVFINLSKEVPDLLEQLVAIFQRRNLRVVRVQMDSHGSTGSRHRYCLQDGHTKTKLSDPVLSSLKEELEALLPMATLSPGDPGTTGTPPSASEQESTQEKAAL